MIFVIAKLIVILMNVETMNAYYFNIKMIFFFYIFSPIKKRIYIFYCSNFIAIYFISLIKMENK
jgi:hypothetical protein